jgi:site-specific recombinase XerD
MRVPKALAEHPMFEDKTFIRKSLKTDSLRVALDRRDRELSRLESLIKRDVLLSRDTYYDSLVSRYGHPAALRGSLLDDAIYEVKDAYTELTEGYAEYSPEGRGFKKSFSPETGDDPAIQAYGIYLSELEGKPVSREVSLKQGLAYLLEVKQAYSPKELNRYTSTVEGFLHVFGSEDLLLSKIDKSFTYEYIRVKREDGLTDKTIKNHFSRLSAIFNEVSARGLLSTLNPFTTPNLSSKVTNPRESYTVSEVKTIYTALPEDSKLIWKMLYYTGLRPKELFKFNSDSIVMREAQDKSVLCFLVEPDGKGKTDNATRYIPVHPDLIPDLEGFEGFTISQSTFEKRRRKAVISCFGTEFADTHDTYSLRHTFVTALINKLENADLVKWLAGHSRSGDVTFYNYFHGYGLQRLEEAVKTLPGHL